MSQVFVGKPRAPFRNLLRHHDRRRDVSWYGHAVPDFTEAAPIPLDLTGLKCPLPALRTRKALRALAPGGRIAVTATDPLAAIDIPNAAREEGARIEAQSCDGAVTRFVIRSRAG